MKIFFAAVLALMFANLTQAQENPVLKNTFKTAGGQLIVADAWNELKISDLSYETVKTLAKTVESLIRDVRDLQQTVKKLQDASLEQQRTINKLQNELHEQKRKLDNMEITVRELKNKIK